MKMRGIRPSSVRLASRKARVRFRRPEAEALEDRMLLYSTTGQWTYSSRITYSFMPDGTSLGGVPSVLFQTMNAVAPTATWQGQIEQAASLWESNGNLNLAQVSDTGAPLGVSGDQQDDPRFGDIRIGAMPLSSGVLAETFLVPPTNGGTIAGDIIFNSTIQWQINTGFDLATIAAHEFGHAVGLGDNTTDSNAVMYSSYDGIKDSLDSDDIAGLQSLYGAPQYDQFNSNGTRNYSVLNATNITPYINGNNQIYLSGLDITSSTAGEWFKVTVPSTNSGHLTVTLQSTNISSLAPALYLETSNLTRVGTATAPTTYGATLTLSYPVSAGQVYYIRVVPAGTYGMVGSYGLALNFGTTPLQPIAPPNTVVPQQPDQGGGSTSSAFTTTTGHGPAGVPNVPGARWTAVGDLAGWALAYSTATAGTGGNTPVSAPTSPTPTPTTTPAPAPSAPVVGPVASPTPIGPVSVIARPVSVAPPAGSPAAPLSSTAVTSTIARHHHRLVHQAVDASIHHWAGHRARSLVRAGSRPDPRRVG